MQLRVREIRDEIGMTGKKLSEKSGVSRATIWKIEKGDVDNTTTKTLQAVADALGVEVGELFLDPALQHTKIPPADTNNAMNRVFFNDSAYR